MYGSTPILTSEKKGPPRGVFVFGKWLDDGVTGELSAAVRLSVSRVAPDEVSPSAGFASVPISTSGANGMSFALSTKDENHMLAYVRAEVVGECAPVILAAELPRVVYRQGLQSLRYFNWSLAAAGLVCAAAMLFLLERAVLARLDRLGKEMSQIEGGDDLSRRLPSEGADELARLGRHVNAMLGRLEESRARLKDNERRVAKARDFYLKILNDLPNPIWKSRVDGACDYFNGAWLAYTGRSLEQELGDGWAQGVHPEDLYERVRTYREALIARKPFTMEYRLRKANGEYGWLSDHGTPMYDLEGEFAGFIGSCYDVTERRRMEEALVAQSKALTKQVWRNELIIHTAMEGYLTIGRDNRIREVNRAYCEITGYSREELLGMHMVELEAQLKPEEVEKKTAEMFAAGSARFETRHRRKDGRAVDIEVSANVIREGVEPLIVAFIRDVTERNIAARKLAYLARTDYLTGIGNRRSFEEAMNGMLERKVLCQGQGFAVVMCDVDDFKSYNDTYGHLKGDDVLADIAMAMSGSLRAGDMLFRYGGEEFVVYLPGADREAALIVADRIRKSVRGLGIEHDGGRHGFVTVSCGIGTCDGGMGQCPGTGNCRGWEGPLARADRALYCAKAAGKDCVETAA